MTETQIQTLKEIITNWTKQGEPNAEMLAAWIKDAEYTNSHGNGYKIEIPARDCVIGRTVTFDISYEEALG